MANQKDWWYLDADGRKIGYLWPEDFSSMLKAYFGKSWVKEFAEFSGTKAPTIYRYKAGIQPIPKTTALLVMMLGTMKARGLTVDEPHADWLPGYVAPTAYQEGAHA